MPHVLSGQLFHCGSAHIMNLSTSYERDQPTSYLNIYSNFELPLCVSLLGLLQQNTID